MANSPATLTLPESYFDLVRPGGAVFGLCTLPGGAPDWLRPAMTLRARLIQVKRVPAGTAVSYAHRYVTGHQTALGVLPLGYNEGIPRHATNTAGMVFTRGRRVSIAGTVNLNHIVLDLGDEPVRGWRRGYSLRAWRSRRADGPGVGRGARHAGIRDCHPVYGKGPENLLWGNRGRGSARLQAWPRPGPG